jgi:putative transposase
MKLFPRTYRYRLNPTTAQRTIFTHWLDLLLKQYNDRVEERLNWWEAIRLTPLNLDPQEVVALSKQHFKQQRENLPRTKSLFPEYRAIHSQVLQNCIERVHHSVHRYIAPDRKDHVSGKPKTQTKETYQSFEYPQVNPDWVQRHHIWLPKIGRVETVFHRPFPKNSILKTAEIKREEGHWYVHFTVQVQGNENFAVTPTAKNTIGIDLGIRNFLVTSDGIDLREVKEWERCKKELYQKLDKHEKYRERHQQGSKEHKLADRRIAKLRQRIVNQRQDFHHKIANELLERGYSFIACESLNIKRMKTESPWFRPAIQSAGWGSFLLILKSKAEERGLNVIPVNPSRTSQTCSRCNAKFPKSEHKKELQSCAMCGLSIHRDLNAALNVKKRAVGITSEGFLP